MTPDNLWQALYEEFYPDGTLSRRILEQHSRSVAELALEINRRLGYPLDEGEVMTAAMLHDIGVFLTDAPTIGCYGTRAYLEHGCLGGDMLRRHRVDEKYARVAERHTGSGITVDEAAQPWLSLPSGRNLCPETDLEQLICYADKFYSKSGDMQQKSLERVRSSMAKFGQAALDRFERLHSRFGYVR